MKYKMLLLTLLGIVGVILIKHATGNLYNMNEPEFLMDTGLSNQLNIDNRIFKTNRILIYKVSFTDSLNVPHLLRLKPNLLGLKDELIIANRVDNDCDYCIDHVALHVFKNKGETGLGETQTIIKYDYYHKSDRVFFGEKTGVIEDSTRVFIHPPRIHFFFYNQFNPFPYVRFPLESHVYWELEFSIPNHALEKVPRLKNSSLKLMYSQVSQEQFKTPWGLDTVYKFNAVGINDEIETRSVYFFSKTYGFVKMEFYTIEGIKISLVLEDIRE